MNDISLLAVTLTFIRQKKKYVLKIEIAIFSEFDKKHEYFLIQFEKKLYQETGYRYWTEKRMHFSSSRQKTKSTFAKLKKIITKSKFIFLYQWCNKNVEQFYISCNF